MKTFQLSYTIEATSSWKSKEAIRIKSNLSDDKLIECEIAQSLVETLKTESAILEPDKLILAIAEAQKREIATSLENMDNMAIQAKVHADKAYQVLSDIAIASEEKFSEIEKKFTDTEKLFNKKMTDTAEKIKKDLEKLSAVEEKLIKIDNWKLEALTENLNVLIKLIEKDKDLVKLVLDFKSKDI